MTSAVSPNDFFKEGLLKAIGQLELSEDKIQRIIRFDKGWPAMTRLCLEARYITTAELYGALRCRINEIGRNQGMATTDRSRADDAASPHAIAYWLQFGEPTQNEKTSVVFDHNQAADDFMKGQVDDLLYKILKDLQTDGKQSASLATTTAPIVEDCHLQTR